MFTAQSTRGICTVQTTHGVKLSLSNLSLYQHVPCPIYPCLKMSPVQFIPVSTCPLSNFIPVTKCPLSNLSLSQNVPVHFSPLKMTLSISLCSKCPCAFLPAQNVPVHFSLLKMTLSISLCSKCPCPFKPSSKCPCLFLPAQNVPVHFTLLKISTVQFIPVSTYLGMMVTVLCVGSAFCRHCALCG